MKGCGETPNRCNAATRSDAFGADWSFVMGEGSSLPNCECQCPSVGSVNCCFSCSQACDTGYGGHLWQYRPSLCGLIARRLGAPVVRYVVGHVGGQIPDGFQNILNINKIKALLDSRLFRPPRILGLAGLQSEFQRRGRRGQLGTQEIDNRCTRSRRAGTRKRPQRCDLTTPSTVLSPS